MANIYFEPGSIRQILKICDVVERRSGDNEITAEMSQGMRAWIRKHGFVTEKQGVWIARNAEYHALKVPGELACVAAGGRKRKKDADLSRRRMGTERCLAELAEIRERLKSIEDALKRTRRS